MFFSRFSRSTNRALPAAAKAGRSPKRPASVRPRLEALEERCTPVVTDLNTMATFATIQAAVTAANSGDVIRADAGVYAENVTINKALTLEGAQHGMDARTRSGAESGPAVTLGKHGDLENLSGSQAKALRFMAFREVGACSRDEFRALRASVKHQDSVFGAASVM